MSSPFLAWIIPVHAAGDAHPEHPIVLPPDQPQPPTDAHPEHPIVIPKPPGYPEHPIYFPPTPTHPIVLPPERPLPPEGAHPEHPIYYPPIPAHPIVIPDPPTDTKPPGGNAGSPENPIELPPSEPGGNKGHWVQAYFPQLNGWIWVWVPEKQMPPHPEPYKGKKK